MKKTLRQLMLPVLESGKLTSLKRPQLGAAKLGALWNNLLEDDAYGGMEMAPPPPPDDAGATADGEGTPDMSHEDHLAHMLKAIVQDEDLSPEEKIDKITKALKLLEEPEGDEEAAGEGGEGEGEAEVPEDEEEDKKTEKKDSVFEGKERQEYLQLKTEKKCRDLCEALSYTPDAIDLKALVGMSGDTDRKAFIRKQQQTASKTPAARPVAPRTGVTRQVREAAEAPAYVPGAELDTKKRVSYWKN